MFECVMRYKFIVEKVYSLSKSQNCCLISFFMKILILSLYFEFLSINYVPCYSITERVTVREYERYSSTILWRL